MGSVDLTADCGRCAALCCVALAFDRSDAFGCDKVAGTPCSHLSARHDCTLHDDLPGHGFAGCARYDCAGAGQRVVQDLFGGRSWRDDPRLTRPMLDAFRALRDVHELLVLLDAAARLPLSATEHARRRELCTALERAAVSPETLTSFEQRGLTTDVHRFVATLRPLVTPPARWRLPLLDSTTS